MKSLSDLIKERLEKSKDISFEEYCENKNIDNPTFEDEIEYFEMFENLNPVDREYSSNDWQIINIYERLGKSLSPDFIYDKLISKFKNLEDFQVVNARDENIVLQFKAKTGFENNPKFKELLNYSNWYINSIISDRYSNKKIFFIEPKSADNATNFIYDECNGIAYKIVNKRKLEKILKFGLNPKRTTDIHDEDNFRNYILANVSKDKIQKDIQDTIEEIQVFRSNKSLLNIIQIDFNKLKKTHNIQIEVFVDPRMEVRCYWTAQYIPASCIKDVTNKFKMSDE